MTALYTRYGRTRANEGANGRAVGSARAADRSVPSSRQNRTPGSAPDDRGDHLAPPERCEMAQHTGRVGAMVDGCADVKPLESSGGLGMSAGVGATAWRPQDGDDFP